MIFHRQIKRCNFWLFYDFHTELLIDKTRFKSLYSFPVPVFRVATAALARSPGHLSHHLLGYLTLKGVDRMQVKSLCTVVVFGLAALLIAPAGAQVFYGSIVGAVLRT